MGEGASGDNGSANGSANGSDEEEETFQFYILSFAYGMLAIVVVGHLVWRWQRRRKNLASFKSHVPGDDSFRSNKLQQRLKEDFAAIKAISPDPRLISANLQPKEFGRCEDGADTPTHWYRMKAFDAAADLVSSHLSLLRSNVQATNKIPPLPEFLALLGQRGQLVERCGKLYSLARYNDGKFGQQQFEEFHSLIEQLQQQLLKAKDLHTAPPSSSHHPRTSVTSETQSYHHEGLSLRTSLEPLIASTSVEDSLEALPQTSTPESKTHTTRTSEKKPPILELSPLVGDSDREETPVSETDTGPRVSRLYSIPETPV